MQTRPPTSHSASPGSLRYWRALLKLEESHTLPGVLDRDLVYYFHEHYVEDSRRWLRSAYYRFKPAIPRWFQLVLRRRYVQRLKPSAFPAWPVEPVVVNAVEHCLRSMLQTAETDAVYRIAPWPAGFRFAFCITHDLEHAAGFNCALSLRDAEHSNGFISSWNIVPARYTIDWNTVERLRAEGCEIGVHGYSHDGRLFDSHKVFIERCAKINECANQWGAFGFRSESTLRNAAWMPSLEFEYDSSFPDTDPYEPQPGGCCSIWPFFIGPLVELPLTMPQDHTLFEILQLKDCLLWMEKADWIELHGGLALMNVHPDYMLSHDRIRLYADFLRHMAGKNLMWHALPRDIARWWRERDASVLRKRNGKYVIEGPAADRGSIIRTSIKDGILTNEVYS